MFNIKRTLFFIAIISTFSCFGSSENEGLITKTEEAQNRFKNILAPLSGAEPIIIATAIVQVAPIAKDGFQYFFPTEEQQVSIEVNREKLKYLKARTRFKECLYGSKHNSERDVFNCPVRCQDLLDALSMYDGQDEAIKIIEKFDRLKRKHV
jgi:hypothetical protein